MVREGRSRQRVGQADGCRKAHNDSSIAFARLRMRFTRHIGIDHAFSFPMSYMQRFGIETWDQFLDDFMRHWPTADPHEYNVSCR